MVLRPLFLILAMNFFLVIDVLVIRYKFTVGFQFSLWFFTLMAQWLKTIESIINYISLIKVVSLLHLTRYWRFRFYQLFPVQKIENSYCQFGVKSKFQISILKKLRMYSIVGKTAASGSLVWLPDSSICQGCLPFKGSLCP